MREILDFSDEELQRYIRKTEEDYEETNLHIRNAYNVVEDMEMENMESVQTLDRMRELCSGNSILQGYLDEKEELLNRIKHKTSTLQETLYNQQINEQNKFESKMAELSEYISAIDDV